MTQRAFAYLKGPDYQVISRRDDGTYVLEPTEAERALKIVDPLGWHFPTAADKERFCDYFNISGLHAGHEPTVQYFGGCYRDYLVPKGGAISDAQRNFVNAIGRDGQNLLARAILFEKPGLIRDLVACGAELNQPCTDFNFRNDPDPMTPLYLAARFNHCESIPVLVQAGAKIDLVHESTGETPLLCAASEPYTSAAAYALIDNGANVDCRDRQGRSPLLYAIAFENRHLLTLLINKRARFDLACYNELIKAPEFLAYVRKEHPSLIAMIANKGDPALIRKLVAQGFEIEARGPDGCTALHVAVGNGNQTLVKQLLSLRADINAVRQPQSMTPLSFAIFGKDLPMFNLLKENGADLGLLGDVDRKACLEFFGPQVL